MELLELMGSQVKYSFKYLMGTRFQLADGVAGQVRDVYFDDRTWEIRHLVTDPADRYSVSQILVPPTSVLPQGTFVIPELFLSLTKEQFAQLPLASTVRPVCQQYSLWNTRGSGGRIDGGERFDPHLRSCKTVQGYELMGPSEKEGVLDDFLIDTATWTVQQLYGRTESAGSVHTFSFAPEAVSVIGWGARMVRLKAPRRVVPPVRPAVSFVQAA